MELKELSRQIKEYRAYTKMNKSLFCKLLGVSPKTLTRLEDGDHILVETRQPFINALNNKTLHPGMIAVATNGRPLKGADVESAFAKINLPLPLSIELTNLIETSKRYQQLIMSWGKVNGRPTMAARMLKVTSQLVVELERPKSNVPKQRHCMMLGMIQGFMIKEGVITLDEAFDDQNTLYYIDHTPVKGIIRESVNPSRQAS
jgi:hypothetical protein